MNKKGEIAPVFGISNLRNLGDNKMAAAFQSTSLSCWSTASGPVFCHKCYWQENKHSGCLLH